MKLLNWFADKQPTNSPSEKTNDGSSTTSAAPSESSFQTTSKVYKFQEKWKTNRSWLLFDSDLNMMYCNVCKQYDKSQKANSFREGTSSFRKQNVDAHEQSDLHRRAIDSKRVMEKPANERPMEKLTTLMSQMEIEQMKILFRTAFYVAKKGKPFSDFPDLLKLQRANGVKISENYCNDKQAKTFIKFFLLRAATLHCRRNK